MALSYSGPKKKKKKRHRIDLGFKKSYESDDCYITRANIIVAWLFVSPLPYELYDFFTDSMHAREKWLSMMVHLELALVPYALLKLLTPCCSVLIPAR